MIVRVYDVTCSELLMTSDDDAALASRLDAVKANQTEIDGKVGESGKNVCLAAVR